MYITETIVRLDSRLTVQERVKLKMQDKAKKKTAERYTAEQLLEKVEQGAALFGGTAMLAVCT